MSLTDFGPTALDGHTLGEQPSHRIVPRDTQNLGKILSQVYSKFCGQPGEPPRAMCAWRIDTSTEESLDEEMNWDELMPRVGLNKRRLKSIVSNVYQARCAELLSDSVDEVVDLFKAEDDVVMMGEMSIFLLPLW